MINFLNNKYHSKLFLLLGNLSEKVCSLFITLLFAKFLSQSEFGELMYNLSFVSILIAISLYGYSSSVVFREFAQDRVITQVELRSMALIINLTYLFGILVLFTISKFTGLFTNINFIFILGCILMLITNFLFGFITSKYSAQKSFGLYGAVQILKSTTLLAINCIFLIFSVSYYSRVWAECIFLFLTLPLFYSFIIKNTSQYKPKVKVDLEKIKYGLGFSIAQLLNIFLLMTDRILIGTILTVGDVGNYALLSQIMAFQFITSTINTFYTADYFKLCNQYDRKKEMQLLWSMFAFSLIGLMVVGLAVFLFLEPFFSWFEFTINANSYLIILLLLVSLMLWNSGQILLRRSMALGFSRPNVNASVCAVLVNLIANLMLLEKLGISGAAYASVLGTLVYFIVCLYYFLGSKQKMTLGLAGKGKIHEVLEDL